MALSSTVLVLIFGTLAGHAFSRISFRGRDLILGGLLVSRMFQGAALLLPTKGWADRLLAWFIREC